jgi:hypothetical protein
MEEFFSALQPVLDTHPARHAPETCVHYQRLVASLTEKSQLFGPEQRHSMRIWRLDVELRSQLASASSAFVYNEVAELVCGSIATLLITAKQQVCV